MEDRTNMKRRKETYSLNMRLFIYGGRINAIRELLYFLWTILFIVKILCYDYIQIICVLCEKQWENYTIGSLGK